MHFTQSSKEIEIELKVSRLSLILIHTIELTLKKETYDTDIEY